MDITSFASGFTTCAFLVIIFGPWLKEKLSARQEKKEQIQRELEWACNDFVSRIDNERALAKPVDYNTIGQIAKIVKCNQEVDILDIEVHITYLNLIVGKGGKKRTVRVDLTPLPFN